MPARIAETITILPLGAVDQVATRITDDVADVDAWS
jgi:hypothetical protein